MQVKSPVGAVTLATTLLYLLIPGTASACTCDGPSAPYVVARGKSLYGIPWRIKTGEEKAGNRRQATFWFSVGTPEQPNDAGYFSTLGLPISRSFILTANSGSGIDPQKEGDVSGIASRRATSLTATMSHGPPLEIHIQVASETLRERYPWLRGLEFFDQYFPADNEVMRVTAYDRSGHVLQVVP